MTSNEFNIWCINNFQFFVPPPPSRYIFHQSKDYLRNSRKLNAYTNRQSSYQTNRSRSERGPGVPTHSSTCCCCWSLPYSPSVAALQPLQLPRYTTRRARATTSLQSAFIDVGSDKTRLTLIQSVK